MSWGYVLLTEDSLDALLNLIFMWQDWGFKTTTSIMVYEKTGQFMVGMRCDPWPPDETE